MKALNLPSWKNVFWFAKDLLRIKSEKDSLNLEWREKTETGRTRPIEGSSC